MMSHDWIEGADSIEIYTDDSYQSNFDGNAAWAFVILVRTGNFFTLIGMDYGLCVTDELEIGWFGTEHSNARAGEIGAQIRAIEWYFAHALDKQVLFLFDAQSIGYCASGEQSYRHDDRAMRCRSP